MQKILIVLISSFLFSINAQAYGTFMPSGNILQKGEYDITGGGQFFSNGQDGSNFLIRAELPFKSNTNLRLDASTGTLAFTAGAHVKWVPFQETERRPNFGMIIGLDFASENSTEFFAFRVGPFASKNFSWEHGRIEPYLGLPTGVLFVDSESEITSQLVVGTKVKFEELKYMSFSIEGAFKVKNAFSHLGVFATIQLGK